MSKTEESRKIVVTRTWIKADKKSKLLTHLQGEMLKISPLSQISYSHHSQRLGELQANKLSTNKHHLDSIYNHTRSKSNTSKSKNKKMVQGRTSSHQAYPIQLQVVNTALMCYPFFLIVLECHLHIDLVLISHFLHSGLEMPTMKSHQLSTTEVTQEKANQPIWHTQAAKNTVKTFSKPQTPPAVSPKS